MIAETPDLIAGRPSVPLALHPDAKEPVPVPRIFRITIRSAYTGKQASVFAKIPYGGVYACTEQLTRAMLTGEILSFSIRPAKTHEITANVRASLQRWPEALRSMSERTGVTWLA